MVIPYNYVFVVERAFTDGKRNPGKKIDCDNSSKFPCFHQAYMIKRNDGVANATLVPQCNNNSKLSYTPLVVKIQHGRFQNKQEKNKTNKI